MERQLFLHHYFPALYFGLLALGHCFQLFASIFSNRKTITYLVFGLIFSSSLYSYYQRLPLTNGGNWTVEKCEATKWLSGWDYNCANYPYENADTNAPALAANQGYDFDAAVKPAEILQNGNEQQQPLVNSIAKDEL
jgi:dolichyl-phosphate-mannose-protein mannosyltransferase